MFLSYLSGLKDTPNTRLKFNRRLSGPGGPLIFCIVEHTSGTRSQLALLAFRFPSSILSLCDSQLALYVCDLSTAHLTIDLLYSALSSIMEIQL